MKHTLVIAEAGVNHNGSLEMAKQLIDVAAEAGVDYVKFQTFKAELLVSKNAVKAEYQQRNLHDGNDSQYQMLKHLELTWEQHLILIDYCKKKGVKFFSTAFDLDSIDFLAELHLGLWKIPSGEITNYPYLRKIAQKGEPVILSSGMSGYREIEEALAVLVENGVRRNDIIILHCNTEYPTPMEDVNLRAMQSIAERFHVKVGYSRSYKRYRGPCRSCCIGGFCYRKAFYFGSEFGGAGS